MSILKTIRDKNRLNNIKKSIKQLVNEEENIKALENEKNMMEEKNPLIGKIGISLGFGSPPPGFENTIQSAENRFSSLIDSIKKATREKQDIIAKLQKLTGKSISESTEWIDWFKTTSL
jgi:hypothetical protein